MSGILDDFFETPIPVKVWHYTSLDALQAMLASGTIWATEAHFTTDPTEFVHARDVANSFLNSLNPGALADKEAKRAALDLVRMAFDEGALSTSETEVFIASFTSARDLKSQWIAYADSGKGVSIAFALSNIRPPKVLDSAVTFAPCVYTPVQKENLIQAALTHIMRTTGDIFHRANNRPWIAEQDKRWKSVDRIYGLESNQETWSSAFLQRCALEIRPAIIRSCYDLLRIASHCKHPSFFEEHEWRLALPHTKALTFARSKVEYRNKPPIPYVAHKIMGLDRLPITEVMIGPYCQEREKVKDLMKEYGYFAEITTSELPVRQVSSTLMI
jgi:hypothetical protein